MAELEALVTKNISFINEGLLPQALLQSIKILLKNIDQSDTPFVALARHLDAKLWTGDMHLYAGLKQNGLAMLFPQQNFHYYWMI